MSGGRTTGNYPAPPEVSPRAAAIARRVLSPLESFLHVQAASGLILLAATAVALFVANSPWGEAYHHWLEMPVGFRAGGAEVERTLHFWINEALMTFFFFVVGLEIRREMHDGELANPRRAALPIAAALGGMLAPAALYVVVNLGNAEGLRGWGVPMATDIAFAVGVLALLGPRVPPALRVLLLALAIIDDIGSILVIALFYSAQIRGDGVLLVLVGVLAVLAMQRLGVRRAVAYLLPGALVWLGVLRSGVHPTIAGVIIGLLTPAHAWLGPEGLVKIARGTAARVESQLAAAGGELAIHPERLAAEAAQLDRARREAISPAARLQMKLHPWVAFGVMPVFALANAGVHVAPGESTFTPVSWGIVLGLVLGKPLGVVAISLGAARLGVAVMPKGIQLRELLVLGVVSGIGFTMALFVGALAFERGPQLEEAKTAVLIASGLAIALGLGLGRVLLRPTPRADAAANVDEAEREDDV